MTGRVSAFVGGWFFFSFMGSATAAEWIRVAYVSPGVGHSLSWIAKETGLFAKHGLDAEVILLTGSPRLVQSLIAGDVHYGVAGASAVMRARMGGADMVILATTLNASSQKLLVNPKSGIRQLEDLKGRVMGVSQYGSEADVFARFVVNKAGLMPGKDVPIFQFGGHPQVAAALIAGKIEAGVLGGSSYMAAHKAGAVVLTSAVELKMVAPSATLATTGRYVQRNRESVTRFMRAYVEAFDYFKTHRDGTIRIFQKYMGGISAENARFLYDENVELLDELPVPAEKGLRGVLDRESDSKAKSFRPAEFVDLSFLKEIDRGGLVDKIYRK